MDTIPTFKYTLTERDYLPLEISTFEIPENSIPGSRKLIFDKREFILARLAKLDALTNRHDEEDDREFIELLQRIFPNKPIRFNNGSMGTH